MRQEPFLLPDDTPSYRDYTESRSNRYLSPEMAAKNRVNAPSPSLYFFNAPPDLDEEQINEVQYGKGGGILFSLNGQRQSSMLTNQYM